MDFRAPALLEALQNSIQTPLHLVERLGLEPTPDQRDFLIDFESGKDILDFHTDPDSESVRAAMVCALWKALKTQGSQILLIAPNRRRRELAMEFLKSVAELDPALNAFCKCLPHKVQVGESLIFSLSNAPGVLRGIRPAAVIGLDWAGSVPSNYFRASTEAAELCRMTGAQLIRVW